MKKVLKLPYEAPISEVFVFQPSKALLLGSNEDIIDGGEGDWDTPVAPEVWDFDLEQFQIFN
jgi:hypothetical protein